MIAFIDVSGDPYSQSTESEFICISVVCIRKRSIYDVTAALHGLKRDILVNEYMEMKSTQLVNRSTLEHPDLNKAKFLEKLVRQCIDNMDCRHAAVIFKNSGDNQKSDEKHFPKHYVDALWRIEAIAREWKVNDVLVVIDNNTRKIDKYLAFAFNNYIYRSSGGSELVHILPVPLFADSETTAGLQMADISAGILRNYYSNNLHISPCESTFDRKLKDYYDIIKSRSIDRRISNFKVNGIFYSENTYKV